ncbi:hypothetical protein QR680_014388 [Steinernema hermaphroditum]|uniref:Uncharacterized protein n=1 Tax=Steinernema hermaphroditum TaxID=289476 RepID=A0AA39I8P3_9BILA|nr:hypothetical protein QR680_014388 [Steinernema hermaphroditum]
MNTRILIFCIFAIGFGLATTSAPYVFPQCYWTNWKTLFQSHECKKLYYKETWIYAYPFNVIYPIIGWKQLCCPTPDAI